MIELGRFAREGRLQGFLEQPWLQSHNGVEGVALAYDERLVSEAERLIGSVLPGHWRGTIEHSGYVAMLLAAAGEKWEGTRGRDLPDGTFPRHLSELLSDWWTRFLRRSQDGERSPIVVEVAVGKYFGREARPERGPSRDYPYRYRIRRSRGARLQAAASGGRIAERGSGRRRVGTTGGFLVDDFSGETWSVTADHVCGGRIGRARAMPLPRGMPFMRQHAGHLFGAIGFGRFGTETCRPAWSSPPDVVPMPQCAMSATPQTAGLDVALHAVASKRDLFPVGVVSLADISQVLELTFCGMTTGLRRVAPTSYSLWHSYELDGQHVCVHDCVQIRLHQRPYVRTDLSSGGDSGSWLLARGRTGLHWVGLLTGGDGDRAGIVPARRIVDAIEDDLSTSVSAFV